jgi:hypothetical protein
MSVKIQIRRNSSSCWSNINPILLSGEFGYEIDTGKIKVGNGIDNWNDLPYSLNNNSIGNISNIGDIQYKKESSFVSNQDFNYDEVKKMLSPGEKIKFNGIDDPLILPESGKIDLYAFKDSTEKIRYIEDSGAKNDLQNSFYNCHVMCVAPGSGSTTTAIGLENTVTQATHPSISSSSYWESIRRWRHSTAATANTVSSGRCAFHLVYRGNAFERGGFFFSWTFAVSTNVSTQRCALGLLNITTARTNAEPSAFINSIIIANDSSDNNFQIMHNGASGTATKVDLGSNFPCKSPNVPYYFSIFAEPNSDKVDWFVLRLDNGQKSSGFIDSNLPVNTTFLTRHEWIGNGATASVASLDVSKVYGETLL